MTYSAILARYRAACCGVVTLMAAGCDGNDGQAGPSGIPGTPGVATSSVAESLTFSVDQITIASPAVLDFTLANEDGVRFTGLRAGQIRFTLAKLVTGLDGNASVWQSYINRIESPGPGPGTEPRIQATAESNGTLQLKSDGTYRYTFAIDLRAVASPIAVSFEPTRTHRLGVQISGGDLPVTNAVYDWRPADGATRGIAQRDIATTTSCNQCHGRLALHGGNRIDVRFCVTCHNPGSTDANSGNTVDFRVLIHKIHQGKHLPSVQAGGEYAIWGFRGVKYDYSDVAYPQDIRNCTKCHDAEDPATPQGGHWESQPSIEACGSCHDDVDFATGAGHSSENFTAQNGQCTICHADAGFAPAVAAAHRIPKRIAAAQFALEIVAVSDSAPGQFPTVTYAIENPANRARYNILDAGDPVWANGAVTILLGWNNADHTNEGNGSTTTPASAVTLNGKAAGGNNAAPAANADGTFTVRSLRAVPAGVTGSGVAGMTARAAGDLNGDGDHTDAEDRIPIRSVVRYFAITDLAPVARRSVVDIVNQCDDCHDQLTLHGQSRTDEPQVCAICHNPRNTDIARRPKNPDGTVNVSATADGLGEQSVDFKRMVHAIHAARKREQPFVVYGFGGSVNDFSGVRFPGLLGNCRACHKPETFALPLASGVLATTVDTGNLLANAGYIADPGDDRVTTPTAAACSACHDSAVAQTHMEQNGAQFSILVTDANAGAETCVVCHGPGRLADVSYVHSIVP